jgi:hypothetical protein
MAENEVVSLSLNLIIKFLRNKSQACLCTLMWCNDEHSKPIQWPKVVEKSL